MNRYSFLQTLLQPSPSSTQNDSYIGYVNVKYPEIPLDFSDIYMYVDRGDRYDTLALEYYGDSRLWWIISRANTNQTPDSLIPDIGSQIRIPGKNRVFNIINQYETMNQFQNYDYVGSYSDGFGV